MEAWIKKYMYMQQHLGYSVGDFIWKLNKSIYGLRQASKSVKRSDRFYNFVIEMRFRPSQYDFWRCELLIHEDVKTIHIVKSILSKEFEDLVSVKSFLGINIDYNIKNRNHENWPKAMLNENSKAIYYDGM